MTREMEQARVSSTSDLQSDVNAWTFILGARAYMNCGLIDKIQLSLSSYVLLNLLKTISQ